MIFLDERDTPSLLTRCNERIRNKIENLCKGLLRNKNCVCVIIHYNPLRFNSYKELSLYDLYLQAIQFHCCLIQTVWKVSNC